jgi:indole-3-glycerol phosphate synthase
MGDDILSRIVEHKIEEVKAAKSRLPEKQLIEKAMVAVNHRSFLNKLSVPEPQGVNIIAEIKRASPSKGLIRDDLNVAEFGMKYEAGGAAAISVLTDQDYFHGSCDDLVNARQATSLPVLRKDFLISSYQIYESVMIGADAVLLIVRALAVQQLRDYLSLCEGLGIDALVEVHSENEFESAALAGARLIGVNNRDLDTFITDINTSIRLAALFEEHHVGVAESGIHNRQDIEKITAAGIHNFLIGESLVRAGDTEGFLRSLIAG